MTYVPGPGPFNPHAQRTPAQPGFNPHAPRAEQGVIPPTTSKIAAVASPVIVSGPYQAAPPHGREALNRNAQQQRK